MNFADRLFESIRAKGTPLMVGLDPRLELLPPQLVPNSIEQQDVAGVFQRFCCEVIDVVAAFVPIVKPNAAFFESLGPAGTMALAAVNQYAKQQGLLVLTDAKRGDIGSTAVAYAEAYLSAGNSWYSDALTVNPFLGFDTIEPMIDVAKGAGTGLFVLTKTSNPGSGEIQDLQIEGESISEQIARRIEVHCQATVGDSAYGICGAVVGATYPEQIARLRRIMPHSIFLIPGIGAQGGTAADVVDAFDEQGLGAIINSSRGIIFAHSREEFSACKDWQQAVEMATKQLIQQLDEALPSSKA